MTNLLHQTENFPGIFRHKALTYLMPIFLFCCTLMPIFLFCCIVLPISLFYPAEILSVRPAQSATPEKIMIYFYSSESNINNFKSLKMEFDNYLSRIGPYEFQPFSERETFESEVKDKHNCLLLLSSWHYTNIYKKYTLNPELIGVRDGKNYQKRILVTDAKYTDLNSIKNGPVASASNELHTRSLLRDMFTDKNAADSVRILSVPKDIDALMSIGFGVSKCALITESAFNNSKELDPVLYKNTKTLAEGKESLLLILAAPHNIPQPAEGLIKIIEKMPKDPGGTDIIKMLDLDGWKPVDPSDKSKLEG